MKPGKIRPLAICVFRREDRILVAEGYDKTKRQTFYRPLGGRIEFGERAADTVARELREEIQQDVRDLRYLGTLENIFTYEGLAGHEIVLVYDGVFVDESVYTRAAIEGTEAEDILQPLFTAYWKPLAFFRGGAAPLYPDGLLTLLETNGD
jgi:ADP-ribose pyrophosphatase YjhB (NUDIX family)